MVLLSNFFHNNFNLILSTVSISLSSIGLFYYSYGAYYKWNISPEIAVTSRIKPSRDIPMPAFTICSLFYPKELQRINSDHILKQYVNHEYLIKTLTEEEQNYIGVKIQTCGPQFEASKYLEILNNRTEIGVVDLIKSGSRKSFISDCFFRMYPIPCKYIFNSIFTEYGRCDTINSQGYFSLFNKNFMHKDFEDFNRVEIAKFPHDQTNFIYDFVNDSNENIQWTLENGYNVKEQVYVQPLRGLKENTFRIVMKTFNESGEYMNYCIEHGTGYKIIIHMPNEMPTPFHEEIYLNEMDHSTYKWSAFYYSTNEKLRLYTAEERRCFFEGERTLKFFKSYTKNHCDYECLTNYTLSECGCVKFSMPRSPDTKVCDIDKVECYFEAITNWPNTEVNHDDIPCKCYPPCTDIKYDLVLEKNYFMMKRAKDDRFNTMLTRFEIALSSHVIQEYESFVPFTLQNFIADCGGLIGLFLGFSLLTIFELLFNIAAKLIEKLKRNQIEVEETRDNSNCCHHCEDKKERF